MKKTYIQPTACTIKISTEGMLALSKVGTHDTDTTDTGASDGLSNKRTDLTHSGIWENMSN